MGVDMDELEKAHSFYKWYSTITETEKVKINFLSTDPSRLKLITEDLASQLQGSPVEGRAEYWRDLYANTEEVLDESAKRAIIDALKKVFIPPAPTKKLPSDTGLAKLAKSAIRKLKKSAEEVEGFRQKTWNYRTIKSWYREDELIVMSKALGYAVDEPELRDEDRKKWAYKWRVWAVALNVLNMPRYLKFMAEISSAPIEYTIALITWMLEKVYGKKVAEDVTNNALAA